MSKDYPSNHGDDGPTEYELQALVLDVAREEFKPLLQDYAAEYAASVRAYNRGKTFQANAHGAKLPVYDSSHLDSAYAFILARSRLKVLEVLKLEMRLPSEPS